MYAVPPDSYTTSDYAENIVVMTGWWILPWKPGISFMNLHNFVFESKSKVHLSHAGRAVLLYAQTIYKDTICVLHVMLLC
jgi:hypothetical protein